MIRLLLPFPPSTNGLFRDVTSRDGKRRGRIATKHYDEWKREATKAMWQQPRQEPIKGRVSLTLLLGPPDRRRRDISNYIKAPEDFLVRHGLIEDDSLVAPLNVDWSDKPGVEIIVAPLEGELFRAGRGA